MPDPLASDDKLSQSLDAGEGLQQFRSVSQRPKPLRDDPFGRPSVATHNDPSPRQSPTVEPVAPRPAPASVAPEPPATVSAPIVETSEPEPDESLNTEKLSVPLSRTLCDRSDELARLLNRSRSIRKSRITRNSVIRVALQ